MIAMIDMGLGNLRSVENAFRVVGAADIKIVTSAKEFLDASAIILPGVGAFADGLRGLQQQGLIAPLKEIVQIKKVPLLGICVGMQLLADDGEEHGHHEGLGLIAGSVKRISQSDGLRIPNMGWCDVQVRPSPGVLFRGLPAVPSFYFAHSYHFICRDETSVAATLDYGGRICAAIENDNVFGVQFHPEKSQDSGLSVLRAFVEHINSRQIRDTLS